jgi:hypothetical protein
MTAPDLYEIVRDVPREAWPDLTYTCGDLWIDTDGLYPGKMSIIESAFVGSMIIHLAKRGFFPTCNVWDDGKNPRASVLINNRQMSHGGSSLVAALAAACKEVGDA